MKKKERVDFYILAILFCERAVNACVDSGLRRRSCAFSFSSTRILNHSLNSNWFRSSYINLFLCVHTYIRICCIYVSINVVFYVWTINHIIYFCYLNEFDLTCIFTALFWCSNFACSCCCFIYFLIFSYDFIW